LRAALYLVKDDDGFPRDNLDIREQKRHLADNEVSGEIALEYSTEMRAFLKVYIDNIVVLFTGKSLDAECFTYLSGACYDKSVSFLLCFPRKERVRNFSF
jgi:hypothetical protein